jgi:hypothetical protein
VAASDPLFTLDELTARIGGTKLRRALDDWGAGTPDADGVAIIQADCATWVRGKIGPVTDLATLDDTTAGDLKRIALDVARAYLCEYAPEVMRQDAAKIFERAAKDIKMIRMGEASLGTEAAPEPLKNHGGEVTSGDIDDPCPKEHFALDGTGDF